MIIIKENEKPQMLVDTTFLGVLLERSIAWAEHRTNVDKKYLNRCKKELYKLNTLQHKILQKDCDF